ncbi:MAG: response regulator [Acidobacteriota bacterium]
MKIVLVDRSAADRKYYRILLSQSLLAQAAPAPASSAAVTNRDGARGLRLRLSESATGETAGIVPRSPVEFFEASLGIQGLELCRNIQPDCILLDYQLPDMDGLEFLAELKADRGEPCAVVMLTGLASEQAALSALRAGAQDYLVKDCVNTETLNLAIEKAIQKVDLIRRLQNERDQLVRAVADRDELLQESHHRVKNHLQVIGSLLQMQAALLDDNRANAQAADALRDCQHRVEAIGLVQDQLHATGGECGQIDLDRQATALLKNLCIAFGVGDRVERRVIVAGSAGPITLPPEQAVPVGLLLNELILNALKHAFPEGRSGFIEITAHSEQGTIELSVRDNGAGVGKAQSLEAPASGHLGWKILQILARQLKGTLRMQQEDGAGFQISFPEAGAERKLSQTHVQEVPPARKLPGSMRTPPAYSSSPGGPNPNARPMPRFLRVGK